MNIRDNIHWSNRAISGYNKPINIVLSAREAAKSTVANLDMTYSVWLKTKAPTLYLVRNSVEINEMLIDKIQATINKWIAEPIQFEYKQSEFVKGCCDLYVKGEIMIRLLSCSIPMRRLKQGLLPNVSTIIADEWFVNPKLNEKYLKGEALILKEIYTTYKRERLDKGKPLKMWFLGNVYSLYNPIFMWLGISPNKLRYGEFLVGDNYVVEWYALLPELVEKILAEDPLYEFDEEYKQYALNGQPINDTNIKVIVSQPPNYQLRYVFRIENKYIGIFQNNYWEDHADIFYCRFLDVEEISRRRVAYVFNFSDMVSGTELFSKEEINRLNKFKIAMRRRLVAFQSIDCYYLTEEIYYNL